MNEIGYRYYNNVNEHYRSPVDEKPKSNLYNYHSEIEGTGSRSVIN